jgi:hypothetical protein
MLRYKKIFVYHYRCARPFSEEPLPSHNLQQIGCVYEGWFDVAYDRVGEVWKYASKRHRILVQMSLPEKCIVWHEDWVKQAKRHKKQKCSLDAHIKRLIHRAQHAGKLVP